jgi:hypothetical protein
MELGNLRALLGTGHPKSMARTEMRPQKKSRHPFWKVAAECCLVGCLQIDLSCCLIERDAAVVFNVG